MTITEIVLLSQEADGEVLANVLRDFNPRLQKITVVPDKAALDALPLDALGGARLISFCSSVIVPAAILNAFPGPSYNFHPGPPDRPGRFPSVFAIYEKATIFGVTVHEMVAQVDAGPIVAAEWFELPHDSEVAALELRALGVLFSIFKRLAPFLAMNPSALPRIYVPWSGEKRTKAHCDAICRLTPDLDADEIALRTRACGTFLRN